MPQADLLAAIQSRVARIAVGASTVRGRGNKGAAEASRAFLIDLDLTPFGTADHRHFARALNRNTEALRRALPRTCRKWGLARKVLDIFLRDALYTHYLRRRFNLNRSEAFFELPLDSITATALKRRHGRGKLPRWDGVRKVTPDVNDIFQDVALVTAKELGLERVHLDALWWSQGRDDR